ncbi:hypothetical protein FOS14_20850 [Skermania sp. ID1734]|uniref:hypothetical protein n=1 Tax=Skermania sp. ID1734 TaxID=2597516 RepID=UPI00117BE94B|nr:hypothetical protein [Skermania sp. ID1734]TSD94467.1 hypothetical protein FOS14_20850 [Skermania sp. ID1734]
MDLFDVVRSCIRRWYVVLPLLLIAAGYGYHLYSSAKPTYYSNAVVGLTAPNSRQDFNPSGSPVQRNGILDVGGANLLANIVTIGLSDQTLTNQVKEQADTATYTARMFPVPAQFQQLPLIMIEATAANPASATKAVDLVAAQAGPKLQAVQQQAGVPPSQMVTAFAVSPPSAPVATMSGRMRAVIIVCAAGVGIAIVVAVIIDLIVLRLRARSQKSRHTRRRTLPPSGNGTAAHPPQKAMADWR